MSFLNAPDIFRKLTAKLWHFLFTIERWPIIWFNLWTLEKHFLLINAFNFLFIFKFDFDFFWQHFLVDNFCKWKKRWFFKKALAFIEHSIECISRKFRLGILTKREVLVQFRKVTKFFGSLWMFQGRRMDIIYFSVKNGMCETIKNEMRFFESCLSLFERTKHTLTTT